MAIGIYLALELEVPILIGGIIHCLIKGFQARSGQAKQVTEGNDRRGLLFASGLITGEALVGVCLAIPIVVTKRPDALALGYDLGPWPGLLLLAALTIWLYRIGRGSNSLRA